MTGKPKTKRLKARSKLVTTNGSERFKLFLRSPVGIWVGAILLVAILLSLNALIAGNRLEVFLGLNAFEIIVAAIIIWVILLRRRTE